MPPVNSLSSHALAVLQSRMTVAGETSKTAAVSSTDRPPKNRISTTRTLRGSNRDNATSAEA